MTTKLIKIDSLDLSYQTRLTLNEDKVKEYADKMLGKDFAKTTFPAVEVIDVDGALVLVDGYHRVEATRSIGSDEILADIIPGSIEDALRAALLANTKHGIPRNDDDIQCVLMRAWENKDRLIPEPNGEDKDGNRTGLPSKRQLAAITGVSFTTAYRFLKKQGVVHVSTPLKETKEDVIARKNLKTGCDIFGVVIPERILPAFKSKALKEHLSIIGKSRQAMDRLRLEDPSCVAIDQNTMIRYDNLIRQMRMSSVYCVCRACGGVGCYRCSKRGFQTKAQYSMNPPEMKGEKKPSGI